MGFQAKFPGKCRTCEKDIVPGQMILRLGKAQHIHEECATLAQVQADKDAREEYKRRKDARQGLSQNAPQEDLGDMP